MKKGKIVIMMIAIAIVFITAILMATSYDNKKKTEVSGPDDVIIDDLVYREEIKDTPEKVFANYEKNLNEASNVLVEKVIRTSVEEADGNYSTNYEVYVVSNVDLVKRSDDTEDFTEAVSAKEYDDELIKQVSFSDGFGFSYQGLNAVGIYETLIDIEGFAVNVNYVSLDEDRTKLTGQNNYIINDDSHIIEKLLPDYESKDVIEKKAYFQTIKEGNMEIPEFFVAVIKYREGDQIIEKSIYLQISANKWEVV